MKHMRCNACSTKWSGSDNYCPACGSPSLNQYRIPFWEMLWVATALGLIFFLTK